ncbi:hypothetical protein HDU76_001297 [Blyttiomyces sp. JEL0837]|nr:hypothetical protein HDU76_001297 [Blyttiomyces sp. JEL0837]
MPHQQQQQQQQQQEQVAAFGVLDIQRARSEIERASADLERARSDLERARSDLEAARSDVLEAKKNLKEWVEKNPRSGETYAKLEAQLEKREEALEKREAALEKREAALEKRVSELQRSVAIVHRLTGAGVAAMDIDSPKAEEVQRKYPVSQANMEVDTSAPVKRKSDEFVADHKITFAAKNDVTKFLNYKIEELFKGENLNATFAHNCLEFNLERRETEYTLDSEDNIKLLVSVSGSGKTRQLLELLHQKCGYYFVSDCQQNDFGSQDLSKCNQLSTYHPEKAQHFINILYVVRGFVCGYLVNTKYKEPHQILLAQLHPKAFFGCDIFADLFESLARQNAVTVKLSDYQGEWFDFVAIDDIQRCLEGAKVHKLPGRENSRPFFSPLVFHSKAIGRFSKFILAGTGINFDYLTEMLSSMTMKDNQCAISDLKPLTQEDAATYIRQMLQDHKFHEVEGGHQKIDEAVRLVSQNPLFLGRGRFVASIVDVMLRGDDVHVAIGKFLVALSQTSEPIFPLRFYVQDTPSLDMVVGGDTLGGILRRGLIQYLMRGKAILAVENQNASDMVRYGIGFCAVDCGVIRFVTLEEAAIIECLRYLIPVSELIPDICKEMAVCPKPQMVGFLLEFLVAYALVAGLNLDNAKKLKSTSSYLPNYLYSNDESEVFFPDHCCGPDIVYKYRETVYIVQVKFVSTISKQARLDACDTTDPNSFYSNRKSRGVLPGFEKRKEHILEALKGFSCKRLVFLHARTQTTEGMDGVEVVNQQTRPGFFDEVHPDMWKFLDRLRDEFSGVWNCARYEGVEQAIPADNTPIEKVEIIKTTSADSARWKKNSSTKDSALNYTIHGVADDTILRTFFDNMSLSKKAAAAEKEQLGDLLETYHLRAFVARSFQKYLNTNTTGKFKDAEKAAVAEKERLLADKKDKEAAEKRAQEESKRELNEARKRGKGKKK